MTDVLAVNALDVAVAEKVMGWHSATGEAWPPSRFPAFWSGDCGDGIDVYRTVDAPDPEYVSFLTDVGDTFSVVDHLNDAGGFLLMDSRYGGTYCGGDWIAYFGINPGGVASAAWGSEEEARSVSQYAGVGTGDTRAEAICRAALRYVEEHADA